MSKKHNLYKLKLEEVELKDGNKGDKSLEFEFSNHDNLFALLEIMKEKDLFESEADSREFLVGLKLMTEVMLRHRKHPLFEEFGPALGDFMKKLKGKK